MELIEDSNSIRLYLDHGYTKKIMDNYAHRYVLGECEDDYMSVFCGALHNEGLVDNKIPFLFNGIKAENFKDHQEVKSFFESISKLVEETNQNGEMKISSIDDILFLLLPHTRSGVVPGTRLHRRYLDELIEVFVWLRKQGSLWNVDESSETEKEHLESIKFDDLPTAERIRFMEQLERLKIDIRAIQPGNVPVYIPNDFEIVIRPRKGTEGEGVVLPWIFRDKLYRDLLQEIVEWHERYNTQFYKMLLTGEVNLHKLENRTKYKNYRTLNEELYILIVELDLHLKDSNTAKTKNIERYAFIHDLLVCLSLLEKKVPLDKKGKFNRIREIIRVNSPHSRKSGETQFFV